MACPSGITHCIGLTPCFWLQVEEGGGYCQRVHDLQTYGEVNREVADPTLALHLSGGHTC